MTLLLLDTTFLIDAERTDAQLDQAIDEADDIAISAITVAELLVGVRQAGRPRSAHDLIIAADARSSKRTVVTSDLTAFADLPGVTVLDHR